MQVDSVRVEKLANRAEHREVAELLHNGANSSAVTASEEQADENRQELQKADKVILSNFDNENPLIPPLFPNSMWRAGKGADTAVSTCQVDGDTRPVSRPFCLRWSYQFKGTWAAFRFLARAC
jgi:hypothetical protein